MFLAEQSIQACRETYADLLEGAISTGTGTDAGGGGELCESQRCLVLQKTVPGPSSPRQHDKGSSEDGAREPGVETGNPRLMGRDLNISKCDKVRDRAIKWPS